MAIVLPEVVVRGDGGDGGAGGLQQLVAELAARVSAMETELAALRQVVAVAGGHVTITGTKIELQAGGTLVKLKQNGITLTADGSELSLRADAVALSGTSLSLEFTGDVDADVQGNVRLDGARDLEINSVLLHVTTPRMQIDSPMVSFAALVRCDTIVASTVMGSTYTPGAGNVW